MTENPITFIECSCHSEIVRIERWDDMDYKDFYFSIYRIGRGVQRRSLWERIKYAAWQSSYR